MRTMALKRAIEAVFSRPPLLKWYCKAIDTVGLDSKSATADFFERASSADISPVRFFDPNWFRTNYRVTGINAFLNYMTEKKHRLAWPSPFFAPRWYSRKFGLTD